MVRMILECFHAYQKKKKKKKKGGGPRINFYDRKLQQTKNKKISSGLPHLYQKKTSFCAHSFRDFEVFQNMLKFSYSGFIGLCSRCVTTIVST